MRKLFATFAFFITLLANLSEASPKKGSALDSTIRVGSIEKFDTAVVREFDDFNILPTAVFDPIIKYDLQLADSVEYHRAKALKLHQEVNEGNLMIANLNALSYLKLPVGIQKQIGPLTYTIIFSSVEGSSDCSLLEAYFMFEIPNTGDKIAFRGSKIPFSNVKGFSGRGKLELIGDYHIILNNSTLLTIVGKGKSFVEFDCDGFAGMGLETNIEFSRDLIIPEDANGKQMPAPARVKTNFVTQIQSWSDILIAINLPNFQVNGLKDVSFTIQNAFLDWSDLMNPSGIQFPPGYTSAFLASDQPSLWQGIYLQHLDVKLPKSFSKKNSQERVTIGAQNMILDDQGFTGKVFAENVLSLGDMNGWTFTIRKVSLDLVVNHVQGFEVEGKLTVPRLKNADNNSLATFDYLAHKGADGNFLFAIKTGNNFRLPAFGADINLYSGSSVTVVERDDKFFPTATLNGDLTIKTAKAKFNKISFEGLRISTEEPRFDIQTVGFDKSGNQKVSDFPVVINGMALKREPGRIGLGVDLTVNIGGGSQEGGFGGGGEVIVWAKQKVTEIKNAEGTVIGSDHDWEFDKVEIGGINIKVEKPNAYKLEGKISFFDGDAVYGDGFHGSVIGSIGKIGPISVKALFGTTGEFRYWYADALVKLPTSVPIVPGVLMANSFGGGFYSKMKQTEQRPPSNVALTGEPGALFYIPDATSLGIKAIMGIESVRKEAMNGVVMLEVMMNRHGGINSVVLDGKADFMSFAELATSQIKDLAGGAAGGMLTEKLAKLAGGQITGKVRLSFDNVNDVFHGNMEVFVNVAAGIVRGVGANNRAGWAVLHFEKNDWYIHIGTPTDPIGLEVAKIFQSKSYFMLGKNLPGSPPPPSQVTEILGPIDLDYMRDMNALQSGAGFAFGLHFIVDTGDLRFLMFYGRFAAGTGIDFMLKDYGTSSHCQGSTGPFGINGWYANGQAYAFVMGKIGVKVNLKFYKGNFDIMNIGAAAVLQAKGPNPFWMKGTVGGYYSILGGMVKGNCKFDVEVGQKCVPVGEQNVLSDQQMIAEISPASGATKVDVFTNPQVAFNIPVGEIFEIADLENKKHFYRATLGQFEVFESANKLDGTIQWNADNNVAVFDAFEILPGEKNLTVKVKLAFEERRNGAWSKVVFQGAPVEEFREVSFQTDKAPDYIPKENVAVSYPVDGQLNFFPNEYGKGIIQLKDGQSYLFNSDNQWIQKVRMTDINTSKYIESNLAYLHSQKRIVFDLPVGFSNSTIYDFEVLNIPKQTLAIDANVNNIETQVDSKNEGAAVVTTKDINDNVKRLEVKEIYKSRFRTSKHNTFAEKMNGVTLQQTFRHSVEMNVYQLTARLTGEERFDQFEIGELENVKLFSVVADVSDNGWYANYAFPIVYDGYPLSSSMVFANRNPVLFGVPPLGAVRIDPAIVGPGKLDQKQSSIQVQPFTEERFVYDVGVIAFQDFRYLQNRVANLLSRNSGAANARYSFIIMSHGPRIRYGSYDILLNYVIPGYNVISTTVRKQLFNPIFDND